MKGIMNAKNWYETIDIGELKTIKNRAMGERHVPINHGECLDFFKNKLSDNNVNVLDEVGMLSNDEKKYLYVVEAKVAGVGEDVTFKLGFINYNNQQKSLTVVAGEQVLICSNEMYTGEMENTKRRHTKNAWNDIGTKFDNGIEYFEKFVETRTIEIGQLKGIQFPETALANMVLKMHRGKIVSNTNIDRIIEEFDNPSYDYGLGGSTAWDFMNAYSHIRKQFTDPISAMQTDKFIDTIVKQELLVA